MASPYHSHDGSASFNTSPMPPRGPSHDMDPTAAAYHPSSSPSSVPPFRVADQANNAGDLHGGIPPHSTFLGVPIPPGSCGPITHPSIPEFVWVLDPLTRKLRVPTALIIPTAATATLGTTPSLCLAFLEHRCRHPWCRQAHIPPAVVQRLRNEAQSAPTCCNEHQSPHDITFLTSRFSHIEIGFLNGQRLSVPTQKFAVTVGLQRHLAQVVPRHKTGPSFEVSSRMVCRLHLGHRCRYLEDCNNLHVCREFDAIQRAFAELGPDRSSPVVNGTPTPPPSSSHSTPIAAGQPSPCPPSYDASLHHGGTGRSPPFSGLPPPSPIVSPSSTFVPAPSITPNGILGQPMSAGVQQASRPATSLHNLTPQSQQITVQNRLYNVTVLRSGVLSDDAFAKLAEAQTTLFGAGRVETIDLLKIGSKPPSPAPYPPAAPALNFGASLSTLPPPLAPVPAAGSGNHAGGVWSMDTASRTPNPVPTFSTPQRNRAVSLQGSGDRGKPLVSLFSADTGSSPVEHNTSGIADAWGH